jgi:hypothetical protein
MTRYSAALALLLFAAPLAAEQFQKFDDIEVHYVVVNTSFLDPAVAARYGVARGKNRAFVNLSVLDRNDKSLDATVTGTTLNLLNQESVLTFSTIKEADSIYFIAPLEFTDRDTLRFRIDVVVPGQAPMRLEFQQQMFVDP